MRIAVFVLFLLLGSIAGALAALNDNTGLKFVLGSIGAVAGAAIGGALAGIGRRRGRINAQFSEIDERTTVQKARARNYWLDRGRLTGAPGLPHANDSDPHSHEP